MNYAIQVDSSGFITGTYNGSQMQPAPWFSIAASEFALYVPGSTWNGSAVVPPIAVTPPAPTLSQSATAALAAGLAITSASTPALDATYPCDVATQSKLNSMYSLIQRAGGSAFPGGLTALPWPTITAEGRATVTFNSVTEFLAMETAVGTYVLALDLIVTTGAGTLPPATATIP